MLGLNTIPRNTRSIASTLKVAIANLECFVRSNKSAPIPNVLNLAVIEGVLVEQFQSPLNRAINIAGYLLRALFSNRALRKKLKNKSDVQDTVLRAIDVIKRNHALLEQLQTGSLEERQLAASAFAVIQRYNMLFEAPREAWNWQKILGSFYQLSGLAVDEDLKANRIDLPMLHKVEFEKLKDLSNSKISLAFQSHLPVLPSDAHAGFSAVMLTQVIADPLSKREIDLLRMKANTIIKHHGIKFSSMTEALHAIKDAPITTHLNERDSTVSLNLSLMLLPGLVVDIEGVFKRSNTQPQHSVPLSDQFRLVYNSIPNGFPHPMQYTGWTLENVLIPSYPHRLDQLPLFKKLYARKQTVAASLLPSGALFTRARSLWKSRAALLKDCAQELLQLHEQLNLAIVRSAPLNILPLDAEGVVRNYFEYLKKCNNPLEHLAKAHCVINTYFIQRQYCKLQETWLDRTENSSEHILQTARSALAADNLLCLQQFSKSRNAFSEAEQHAFEFCKCLGMIIQNPAQSILLQYYSETFACAPRMLTDFEQKLQIAAYKQLYLFLDELEGLISVDRQTLLRILESDIALFQNDACDAPDADYVHITHELEVYFNSRYYAGS